MQFCCLGSGSKGNATLVRSANALLMIDCGFSLKYMLTALESKGCSPADVTAILVTHEHGDHVAGVNTFAKRFNTPVYLTAGTARSGKVDAQKARLHTVQPDKAFTIADITIQPVTVPHDAREPCQFVFRSAGKTLGVMTDLGSISPHVASHFQACDSLLLEANHDVDMLWGGSYPPSLKQRVLSDWGHLSNVQAAAFLATFSSSLNTLVLGHISEKNNSLDIVQQVFSAFEGLASTFHLASQESGFDWLDV